MKKIFLLFLFFISILICYSQTSEEYLKSGIAKLDLKDYKGAIRDFSISIEINPLDPSAYYNRGFAKDNLEDYQGAIADYSKAIENNPLDASAYSKRGVAKANLKDYKGAIEDYNDAIEINPTYAYTYFIRGNSKLKLQNYQAAIADYNKAIEIDPNYEVAYSNRGLTKVKLQDYQGSITDYNIAIEFNPNNSDTYSKRGFAKINLKDYQGAIADYSKAIEFDPNFPDNYFNRGLTKISLGQKESGCLDLSKAGELGLEKAYAKIKEKCQGYAESSKPTSNSIPMIEKNGVYEVPITINNTLRINFIFDAGASDVSISADVALTLIRTGTVTDKDFIGTATYRFADGSTAKSKIFIIKELKIGKKIITNVKASISNSIQAPLLLGQTALNRFGKITIDYKNKVIHFDD